MRSSVATAVNQAKRLSQHADDVDLCATFVRFDYSPVGVGADWAGFAAGFSFFGAPDGGTVPRGGPTGGAARRCWRGRGGSLVPTPCAPAFSPRLFFAGASPPAPFLLSVM